MKTAKVAGLLLIVAVGLLVGCKPTPSAPDRAAVAGTAPSTPADPVSQPALAGPEQHILALGDSLFAGFGLRPEQAYPPQLERALRARGINVRVTNAGVSGDTTADGLARLNFALSSQPQPPDLVLICLGGNDMLRGLPPAQTRADLAAILTQLQQRHIHALLMGMLAAPNLGKDYDRAFDQIYPALARQYHDALVPFFLSAVIDRPELRLADHIHPTPNGVEALVKATSGVVVKALPKRTDMTTP